MKNYLLILVAVLSFLPFQMYAAGGNMMGNGSEADPFTIDDYADLKAIGSGIYLLDKYYQLGANIDASASQTENGGSGFIPIGNSTVPFTGHFEGSGYSISNLFINRPATDYIGLFGVVYNSGAAVINLGLVSADITGRVAVGGISGGIATGAISGCNVTGRIAGIQYVGGITGGINSAAGSLSSCYTSSLTINGAEDVGGIIGANSGGSIVDCYTTASVSVLSTGPFTGGICGGNYGSLSESQNEATVSGTISVGGIAGESNNLISECTNKGNISGTGIHVGGITGNNFTVGGTGRITYCNNEGIISTTDYNAGGISGSSSGVINFSESKSTTKVSGKGAVGGIIGRNLGSVEDCISYGELITASDELCGGIAGINQGKINRCSGTNSLNVKCRISVGGIAGRNTSEINESNSEAYVYGDQSVGGAAGENSGIITECNISASITTLESTLINAGGIAGLNTGTISDSEFNGTISSGSNIGGLVGLFNYASGKNPLIENSSNYANISGTSSIGGLVGIVYSELCVIENSNNFGTVTATAEQSEYGGLIGFNAGNISQCNNNGLIVGKRNTGGCIGYNNIGAVVNSCSNNAQISGTSYCGGIVGNNHGSIYNCTNNGEVNSNSWYVGGVVGVNNADCQIRKSFNTAAITGTENVAGITGANYGSIWECSNSGMVLGSENYIGGIAGFNNGGLIERCFNKANIKGDTRTGGLVGQNGVNGVIKNGYNMGRIQSFSSGKYYFGGIAGINKSGSTITKCYNHGSLDDVKDCYKLGALAGFTEATIENCFWNSDSSRTNVAIGEGAGTNIISLTDVEMKNLSTFINSGWDPAIWKRADGANNGYPYLSWQTYPQSSYPTVTTQSVTGNTINSATGNGTITYLGSSNPTEHGVCWSTTENPTIGGNKTTEGAVSATGTFTSSITGLSPNTTYYVRAYATNADGTSYGEQVSFVTLPTTIDLSGAGTEADPYIISSLENLKNLAEHSAIWGKVFRQTEDIDASATSGWSNGGWTPIGNTTTRFTGHYDGNGKTITGLFINRSTADYQGLFGATHSAIIKKLGIVNANVTGKTCTGAIAGENSYGSQILECYSSGVVTGYFNVGGIAGANCEEAQIGNSYSSVTVHGTQYIGGAVGTHYYSSVISHCFSYGSVDNVLDAGGLVGYVALAEVNNSFRNITINPDLVSVHGLGKTTAEMQTSSTYSDAGWNADIWKFDAGKNNGYPYLYWQTFSQSLSPTVTTQSVTDITTNSATGNGTITNLGSPNPTEHGVCWSTTENPTINGSNKTTQGTVSEIGSFTSSITGLSPNTTYYVRAYATNANGTSYGEQVSFVTSATAISLSGAGTEADPYLISSLENLKNLAEHSEIWDKVFRQTADIDASETATWFDGKGWEPIGYSANLDNRYFLGEYDGNDHVISGLTINRPTENEVGLIANLSSGKIKNLGLTDLSIIGHDYVGGIAGVANALNLENCYTTGSISGSSIVGGLAGVNNYGIKKCYSACTVNGGDMVGGLVGKNSMVIEDSYATGAVTATGGYINGVGGLVGYNEYDIYRCYATGLVTCNYTSSGDKGGLVGGTNNGNTYNSFWDMESTGQSTDPEGATGLTTSQMKTQSIFTDAGWNTAIWYMNASYNNGYPYLYWQHIQTPEVTTQNVTNIALLSAMGNGSITNLGYPYPTQYGVCWGTTENPTIDGNKTTQGTKSQTGAFTSPITGLAANTTYYVRAYATNAAGTSYGEQVSFVTLGSSILLTGAGTEADPYLINTLDDLKIFAEHSEIWEGSFKQTADIDASATGEWSNGGWIPIGNSTTKFTGKYDGNGKTITGLFIMRSDTDYQGFFGFTNSAVIKDLGIVNASITGKNCTGVLVGENNSGSQINNCYCTGSVIGNLNVGGIAGANCNSSKIINSYSSVNVLGTQYIGGAVGTHYYSAEITNCYSNSTVNNVSDAGGLVGYTDGAIVSGSFWNKSVNPTLNNAHGTAKTSEELKTISTFSDAGWNADIWKFDAAKNNGYPYLYWQNILPVSAPEVTTQNVTDIAVNSATGNGTVTNLGIPDPTEHGVCWSNSENPTIDGNKTTQGAISATGAFTSLITGLASNTTYYVRAYAINHAGTSYGAQVSFVTSAASIDLTGAGIESDPYLIGSLDDLKYLAEHPEIWGACFRQTSNIDASSTSTWANGGWIPIGNETNQFIGKYDGNGKVIEGIFINRSDSDNQGLFGSTNGAFIQKLGIKNANITGKNQTGALSGVCFNFASVNSCFSSGSVNGESLTGGLVGFLSMSSSVANCYNRASVNGTQNVGGLIGIVYYSSEINNSYSSGSVSGTENYGGLAGNNFVSTILNSFWDATVNPSMSNSFGLGKTTAEMKTASTFINARWNSDIWCMDSYFNNGYPYLIWENANGTKINVQFEYVPYVTVNSGARINEGGTFTFTNLLLKSNDPDGPSCSITYNVTQPPVYGSLTKGGALMKSDGTETSSFTQNDIANGKVKYTHSGEESKVDLFKFTISDIDGNTCEETTFVITINGVNDPPVFTGVPSFTINEDESFSVIMNSLYSFVDDPDDPDSILTFSLSKTCENITLTHQEECCNICGIENWFGTTKVKLTVSDSATTIDTTFTLTVLPVNDMPTLNGLPSSLTIINGDIETIELNGKAEDVETPDSLLVWFFIVSPDSVSVSYDETEGIISYSAKGSFNGTVELIVTVTDEDGGSASETITITVSPDPTGINDLNGIPTEYELSQNYPNPFNPSTVIRYGIPSVSTSTGLSAGQAGSTSTSRNVTLRIYDILGNEVATLQNGEQAPGYYERTWNAANVSSGIYMYVLRAGSFIESHKMILLK